ncbi:MAG: hypothetical protein DRO99_04570 [Candidatus Aenigmatarchaeota archaeon]|nr:MAG: hypothetical protein DRO99_04570 [Candidatus Aenigmarchaeota archaeon]
MMEFKNVLMCFVALAVAMSFAGTVSALDCTSGCVDVCVGNSKDLILKIENKGTRDDTYVISNPYDWVDVQDSVFIEAGQTKNVGITVTPAKEGVSMFELTVTGSYEAPKTVGGKIEAIECRHVTVAASPTEKQVCEKFPAVFDIIVKNTGQVEDTYELSTSMGSLGQSDVTLAPGESRTVKLTVDTEGLPGDNQIMVSASSSGVSDTQAIDVLVKNCYSAELRLIPEEKSICPCTSVPYQVYLKNTGDLEDEYTLTIMGNVMQTVRLDAGESRIFNFSVPLAFGAGSREITATAKSAKTTLSDSGTLTVKGVSDCYSVSIAGSDVVEVEACTAETVPLKIKNTGENTQIFKLDMDGPSWVYLSKEEAYVDPGQEKEVYMYISPPYEAVGTYTVKVNATSVFSQNMIELTVKVNPNGTATVTAPSNGSQGDSNVTLNVSGNQSDGITGGIISLGAAPLWKMMVVGVITTIIVVILVVRFAVLVKK